MKLKKSEKMTFFGQDGVENFFFYFSLKAPTKVFKISHSKKIFLEKKFYLKIAVSALDIIHLKLITFLTCARAATISFNW